jgi:hypothetical protein
LTVRHRLVAVGELVDRPLHRAQCLAVSRVGLGFGHLVAEVAHPFGEALVGRLRPRRAGDLRLDLVEQRHQFAAQFLPLAGARLAVVLRLERGSRAGHRSIPST